MIFTDYLFLPFVFVSAGVYYAVPRRRWIVLLAVSLLFYLTWGAELVPFLLGAAAAAWAGGLLLGRNHDRAAAEVKSGRLEGKEAVRKYQNSMKARRRAILWLAVAAILLVLVYTKAQRQIAQLPVLSRLSWFFSKCYEHFARWSLRIPGLAWFVKDKAAAASRANFQAFVPLGISYYSLSLTGYLADVYWKKEKPEKNPLRLLLFAAWFPKILEGPIAKHKGFAEQLREDVRFDAERFTGGLWRILWGFFKKLVIADRLAIFVNTVYGDIPFRHGGTLLAAAVCSAFTLYADFSGCMDIALGTSELFGIRLEENFRQPFFAQSAAEFWRRWHITLGTWFKDYVYMPLAVSPGLTKAAGKLRKRGGKRLGKAFMTVIPLLAVWLLTGLWHGTGWNYVVWGLYWGLLIILSNVFEPELKKLTALLKIDPESKGFVFFRRFRTFALFVVSRIISVPDSLKTTGLIFRRIFTDFGPWQLLNGTLYRLGLNQDNVLVAVISLIIVYAVSRREEQGTPFVSQMKALPVFWRTVLFAAGVLAVAVFGIYGAGYDAGSFVYMRF